MKKKYCKPQIEIETYTLSESIAGNCADVVSFGPGDGAGVYACKEFGDNPWEVQSAMVGFADRQSFYDDNSCSCYYSAGGEGYFTS